VLAKETPGWFKAWPAQQSAVKALSNGTARGLWACTAMGKTAVLLFAWTNVGAPRPLLIVTKAMGRDVFGRDAIWALGRDYIPAILTAGSTQPPGVHQFYGRRLYTSLAVALSEATAVVVNYEILQRRFDELRTIPWRAMFLDEIHEIKGATRPAKKRDGSYHHKRYHRCRALADGVRGLDGPVWSATATPLMNRRVDLYAQIDVIAPGALGSHYQFIKRFCAGKMNDWGGLDDQGTSNTQEFYQRIDPIFHVVRREDIEDQLPPLRRDVRYVPFDSKSFRHLGGGVETALDRAASMKMGAVRDLCLQYLSEGLKVVTVTTRQRLAHKIALELTAKQFIKKLPRKMREQLSVRCVTGETPTVKRVADIQQYNETPKGPAVMSASLKAIRDSVDIQQTDIILIVGLPTEPGALLQLEGRFSRPGGRPTLIIYLIAERTLDEAYKVMVIDKFADAVTLGAETQGKGGVHDALAGKLADKEVIDQLAAALAEMEQSGTT